MFKKHEVKYVWKKRRRAKMPRVEKTFGAYIVETAETSKRITFRFDGQREYEGITNPHGSVAGENLWKWNNDGSLWYKK